MHPNALLNALTEITRLGLKMEHPADAVLSHFLREHRHLFGPRERSTLAETMYAVLRHKVRYEFLARSGHGPRERRMAVLGFVYGMKGNRDFLTAAMSEPEKAWLKNCDDVPDAELMDAHRHNLPEWLAQRLRRELALDADIQSDASKAAFWALVDGLNTTAPLDMRVNAQLSKRDAVAKELAAAGIPTQTTPFSPWALRAQGRPAVHQLEAFKAGRIEVQDEGSQLLALLLNPKRGEMVCDFCAGAGGKTLAIGAAMRNTGRIYAFDVSAHRLEQLKPRLARSGLSNVFPAAIAHERDERIKRLQGKMDRVLVDAPCSGMGTLRRNPDLKWRQKESDVAELALKQMAILHNAARMVKPGGRLVYATCSVLAEENEDIAAAFSAANSEFAPVDAAVALSEAGVGDSVTSQRLVRAHGGTTYLRLWPHIHQTDGFFAAVWQRK